MSKKQLLNESEIRRFMKLANIEPLGRNVVKENFLEEAPMGAEEEPRAAEYELEEVYGEDTPEGDEELDLGEPGGDKEAKFLDAMKTLADMAGVELEATQEGGEEADEEAGDEMEEPADEEEVDDSEEEAGDEETEDEIEEAEEAEGDVDQSQKELQEALVKRVLTRVTNRLVNEAAKAKKNGQKVLKGESDKKKKKGVAARMADKKRKLKEANAPAPKATNSNGPKKGAGSATKGAWGVTSKVVGHEWKQGKEGKGSEELETVSASSDHTHSYGKNNLATKGKK